MNFQAVSVGQKLAKAGDADADKTLTGGYLDGNADPGQRADAAAPVRRQCARPVRAGTGEAGPRQLDADHRQRQARPVADRRAGPRGDLRRAVRQRARASARMASRSATTRRWSGCRPSCRRRSIRRPGNRTMPTPRPISWRTPPSCKSIDSCSTATLADAARTAIPFTQQPRARLHRGHRPRRDLHRRQQAGRTWRLLRTTTATWRCCSPRRDSKPEIVESADLHDADRADDPAGARPGPEAA